mmetsp:Transcript_21965/g.47932  ORF Transcript_21965/g.47932 Transcript_21965/m.47932 type:complete len:342 (+) Transcript_21965:262-1287(+)
MDGHLALHLPGVWTLQHAPQSQKASDVVVASMVPLLWQEGCRDRAACKAATMHGIPGLDRSVHVRELDDHLAQARGVLVAGLGAGDQDIGDLPMLVALLAHVLEDVVVLLIIGNLVQGHSLSQHHHMSCTRDSRGSSGASNGQTRDGCSAKSCSCCCRHGCCRGWDRGDGDRYCPCSCASGWGLLSGTPHSQRTVSHLEAVETGTCNVGDLGVSVHHKAVPLGVASLPVLDQVKRLDGSEGTQQLPALLLCQVVWQATHKHALTLVRAATTTTRSCTRPAGSRQADSRVVEGRVGCAGAQTHCCCRVVIVRPADTHADSLKHDAVQSHGVGALLHRTKLHE